MSEGEAGHGQGAGAAPGTPGGPGSANEGGGGGGGGGRRRRRGRGRGRAAAAARSRADGDPGDGAAASGRPGPDAPAAPAAPKAGPPGALRDARPDARRGQPRPDGERTPRSASGRREGPAARDRPRPQPAARQGDARPAPGERPAAPRPRAPAGAPSGRRPARAPRNAPAVAFPPDEGWELAPGAAPDRARSALASDRVSGHDERAEQEDDPPRAGGESGRFAYAAPAEHEADDLLASAGEESPDLLQGRLCRLVAVRVGATRVVSELDAGDLTLEPGQRVLIEGERGTLHGTVVRAPWRALVEAPPLRVLRVAPDEGLSAASRKAALEQEAQRCCRARIKQYGLPMKLARVEVLQNGGKAVFHFAAETRVDFRELVRDLSRDLHLRVELRQVGVRDEAKLTGGLGPCGRELCCASWINDFAPVSIRMAKDQNLVLNPAKISGMCGRLKCCLAYEQSMYREGRRRLPRVGETVQTPDGLARVNELDIPRQLIRATLSDGSVQTYPAHQLGHSGRGADSPETASDRDDS